MKTKCMIYLSIIQSHINYLAIIYGSNNSTMLKTLQCMQNKAMKATFNLEGDTVSTMPVQLSVSAMPAPRVQVLSSGDVSQKAGNKPIQSQQEELSLTSAATEAEKKSADIEGFYTQKIFSSINGVLNSIFPTLSCTHTSCNVGETRNKNFEIRE